MSRVRLARVRPKVLAAWLAAGVAVSLAGVVGFSLLGSPASAAASPARGLLCAKRAGALVAGSRIAPGLVETNMLSEPALQSTGVVIGSRSPHIAPYQWVQAEQFAIPHLPPSFGLRDPSSLVTGGGKILQAVETIQSFPTVQAAERFTGEFGTQVAPAQVVVGSHRIAVTTRQAVLPGVTRLGEEVRAFSISAPSPTFPAEAQYVIRNGTVVRTLALLGGRGVTAASEVSVASAFARSSQTACGQ